MKTRTKIALGAVALALIAQHQLGRYLFERECRINEGAWAMPIEPAGSLAYDILYARHKTEFDVTYPGSLIDDENRRAFVEYYIYDPSIESLSTEPGWYRYWLARRGDPACSAFEAATSLHVKWRANLAAPRLKRPRLDPDAICIASRRIEAPESRYLSQKRNFIEKRVFGLLIYRHDVIDRKTGEIRNHYQTTGYRGPWISDALNWLASNLTDGGLSAEHCDVPKDRFQYPTGVNLYPKSTLGPLSPEDWPMLPPHSSK